MDMNQGCFDPTLFDTLEAQGCCPDYNCVKDPIAPGYWCQ